MNEPLTIGATAARYGISTHTLRYYDKIGLLPATDRAHGGTRLFGKADLEWLELVLMLKRTGMSLNDIRAFAATLGKDGGIAERLTVLQRQRRKVAAEITALKRAAKLLDEKCALYETALANGGLPGDNPCRTFYAAQAGNDNR